MINKCSDQRSENRRSIKLPVLPNSAVQPPQVRESRTSWWRAAALITLQLLMIAHIVQWRLMGTTVSPIEPSESMYTIQQGAINAGVIFFSLALLATLIFGRFVCGWGCHIVALQDFCAWLMKKIGITPRPFRSRLLVYVPLIAALYMFVWPTAYWAFAKPPEASLIPHFTNHIITNDFWATFPPVWIAIPFLFICGFMTVYFLGSKGFCTYACPYGGFFAIVDKFAPGKIRVTDACNQCGHCTATCTSNVLVHAEVRQYGMVVDPGCMKCMDCVSVCPNDALYFGFGKPSVAVSKTGKRNYSITWAEEIAAAAVFTLSFLAVWDVYQLVPMLMALGVGAVTTFLFIKTSRLLNERDTVFLRYVLKTSGSMQKAGWVFFAFGLLWIGLVAHSGWVRYHERAGSIAFENIQIPDELALARTDPNEWLSQTDRENIDLGKRHFQTARAAGLFTNAEALPKLAWVEYLSGESTRAVDLLSMAAQHQHGQGRALSLYYRGAILNRLGRYDEALASMDAALNERPDLILAREEKGESLWQLGRRTEAVKVWNGVVEQKKDLPLANNLLAGSAASFGNTQQANEFEKQAEISTPADPLFNYMLGLRLENVGMDQLAEKHFQRAVGLNPQLRARRNMDLLERFRSAPSRPNQ